MKGSAQPSSSTISLPPRPPPAAHPSGNQLSRGILRLFDPSPFAQKYMFFNCRAKNPENALQLKHVLRGFGVEPIDIVHYKLFFTEDVYNFAFNVKDSDEQKVDEKLFQESRWTRLFHVTSFTQRRPFFGKSLPFRSFFQTVLVATRLERPGRDNMEREQKVTSATEVRRALKNDRVMEAMTGALNGYGRVIIAKYKKEFL